MSKPQDSSSSSTSSGSSETSSQSAPLPLPLPKPATPLTSDSSSADDSDDDVGGDEKEESQTVRVQDPGPSVPSKKRVHGDENGEDEAKKLKGPVEKKSSQSPRFSRVFTKEDEVSLMRGLVDFCAKEGVNAVSVVKNKELFESFHGFVGRLLHVNVTGKQMKSKIRRMKDRRVKDPALSDMWGRLWMDEKVKTVSENGNGVKDVKMLPEEGVTLPPFLDVSVEVCCRDGKTLLGEGMFRKNLALLGKEEVAYLEKKWTKFWKLDVNLSQRRNKLEMMKNKLINIELRMISEALTRSANQ
ncbi:hypothetical protein QJS10_CPA06g00496 [Acorus calamus]|uniref:Glabrous enhancer-binding protein-like DBD domain-containing protein n=1 Tax=Acorus calamus TaxID=4465 RepID=A0AAV9EKX8_ACOCL|nr:hypothetical protein QJS10_CPA06g00496 [Acorus calamus]